MRDLNRCVQGLARKSLSVRDYTTQFPLLTSRAGLVENEQAHLRRHTKGLHENIQQIVYLQYLTCADYEFQVSLKVEFMLAVKPN